MEPRAPVSRSGSPSALPLGVVNCAAVFGVVIVERQFLLRPEHLIDLDRRDARDPLTDIRAVVVVVGVAVRKSWQKALDRHRDRTDHRQGNHVVGKRNRCSHAVDGGSGCRVENLIGENGGAVGSGGNRRGGNAVERGVEIGAPIRRDRGEIARLILRVGQACQGTSAPALPCNIRTSRRRRSCSCRRKLWG